MATIVASLLGGGIAGYLKRDGASHGVVAGGIAGLLMAVITGGILFVRFVDVSMDFGTIPLEGLATVSALSLVASIGQIVSADLGGRIG